MALTEHGKNNDGKYELTVTIPAKEFCDAIEKVYRRENRRINIPGFRKGKAPRVIIERMYGPNFFFEDAINELLPDEFEKALEEADVKIIDRPELEVTDMGREQGVTAKFTCTLRPELTIKQYKGLEGEKPVYTVEQADIDRELNMLREKQSRIVPVEGRAAENGDIAVIDYEGFIDDKAFAGGKGEGFELTLGSGQFIPGFEEQVVGHKPGEEFDITVKFPEDYNAAEYAGKDATFKIKLHELRKKELPELDDEFAKDASEFDTLAELKDSIVKRLEEQNERRAKSELENSLLDKVVDNLEGDVPHVMIEDQIHQMVSDFDQRLRSQGMDIENYLKYTASTLDALKEQMRDQAVKSVRTKLALEAIIREEKFEITKEEIEAELQKYADDYQMELEKIRAAISEKELAENMKAERAIDLIRDSAKVVEKKIGELVDKVKEEKPKKKTTKKKADEPDEAPAEGDKA